MRCPRSPRSGCRRRAARGIVVGAPQLQPARRGHPAVSYSVDRSGSSKRVSDPAESRKTALAASSPWPDAPTARADARARKSRPRAPPSASGSARPRSSRSLPSRTPRTRPRPRWPPACHAPSTRAAHASYVRPEASETQSPARTPRRGALCRSRTRSRRSRTRSARSPSSEIELRRGRPNPSRPERLRPGRPPETARRWARSGSLPRRRDPRRPATTRTSPAIPRARSAKSKLSESWNLSPSRRTGLLTAGACHRCLCRVPARRASRAPCPPRHSPGAGTARPQHDRPSRTRPAVPC